MNRLNWTLKWGVILFAFAVAGCGQSSSNSEDPSETIPPKELARQDVAKLPLLKTHNVAQYDRANNGAFSAIFGGTSAIDVTQFFHERIKYYLTEDDLEDFERRSGRLKNDALKDPKDATSIEQAGLELGAANIGAALFILGTINNQALKIRIADQVLTVRSPRVGIMQIGKGYRPGVNSRGRWVTLPPIYRQSILVHEARHSDCANGFTAEQKQIWRTSKNARETCERIKDKSCVHFHSFCKEGDYRNVQACDDQPWGAYSVNLVFLKGIRDSYSGFEQALIDAMILEAAGRLNFNIEAMIAGKYGRPNMTSNGVL